MLKLKHIKNQNGRKYLSLSISLMRFVLTGLLLLPSYEPELRSSALSDILSIRRLKFPNSNPVLRVDACKRLYVSYQDICLILH